MTALEEACSHHDDDPLKHAQHINAKVRPAMAELRRVADQLEATVAAEFWTLPTYRELLLLK
jgi:glutamine synthetase